MHRLISSILAAAFVWTTAAAGQNRPRLLAYYFFNDQNATPKYDSSQIPYNKLTHLIHVALQAAPSGDGSIVISPGAIEPELVHRAHAAGVRVIVSVQGPAAAFSKTAADADARARFAQALKDFVTQYGYDGVDIDWEVPAGPADVANCVALMKSIRDALPRPAYLVSMATPSVPGHWGEYDFPSLTPLVDFFNVMTYDFHGPWTDHASHNSPLFPSAADTGHEGSLDDTVNAYLNQFGVPPEKINLGLAFYGYEFPISALSGACKCDKTVLSRNYGSYVKPRIDRDGWTSHMDPIARVPYLVHESDPPGFITYDDPASISRKVTYALETRGLGGVFMWEISEDFDGSGQDLMNAMYRSYLRAATGSTK